MRLSHRERSFTRDIAAVAGGLAVGVISSRLHALGGEDIVYPLLQSKAGGTSAAKQLYSERAEMKVHLYELEMAPAGGAAWAERARALHALIARHIRDEEDVHFPRLEGLLDADGRRRLARQVRREEALIL